MKGVNGVRRNRVYCADPVCSKFLEPGTYRHWFGGVEYGVCKGERCGKRTCTRCKALVEGDATDHVCKENEDCGTLRDLAKRKSYQECPACWSVVELMEACNHIA